MKTLVTGGLGFLGAAVVRALRARGDAVVALDLPGLDPAPVAGCGAEVAAADIRDEGAVAEAASGCGLVVHTAASVTFWGKRRAQQWSVNVDGTTAVMRACLRQKVARAVHVSSVNALGYPIDPAKPGDESTPFNWGPMRIGYMDSKRAAEEVVLGLFRDQGLPAVIVEPGTLFGVGSARAINSATYFQAIARGGLPVYLPGGISCVGLEDVVRGILLAAERGRPGERYILGAENLTYRELFARIAAAVGGHPPRFRTPRLLALTLARLFTAASRVTGREPLLTPEMVYAGSICCFYTWEKARRELGYNPRPFAEVLQETAEGLRAQGRLT